jgi:phosphoserine phosphatase
MDPFSGHILGNNCHDKEKVRRFRLEYPDYAIDEFYSDSLSDTPLASIAARAFLVKGNILLPWPSERRKHT